MPILEATTRRALCGLCGLVATGSTTRAFIARGRAATSAVFADNVLALMVGGVGKRARCESNREF
jgi:hypothetical protein